MTKLGSPDGPERGHTIYVDLRESERFPEAQSAWLFGVWDGTPDEIRRQCAAHYGIPETQVAWPERMTYDEFQARRIQMQRGDA